MELFRLVTVHPALVHFAIGTIPVILLGYAVGWGRRSASWTLVGDVALVATALLTLIAAGFGLVSFFVVEDEDFDEITREALAMSTLAEWLVAFDQRDDEAGPDGDTGPVARVLAAGLEPENADEREFRQGIASMGSVLDLQVQKVLEHSRGRDLVKLSRSVGQLTGACAGCHEQYRENAH